MNKLKNTNSYSFDKNSVEQNDIKIGYLSNKHNNPLAGVGGYVRRRSSGNPLKECENTRRLSSISVHSLALALELRRKSCSSAKSNDGKEGSHTDSTDSKLQETNQQMSFKMKCVYTFIMLMIHHNFGLSLSGFAPSFVDFKYMLKTSMTYIGLFPIFQAIGCLCGSLCGTLYKWIPRQIVLLTVVTGMAFATIFMPYSTELWQIYVCIFFYGFGIGAWNNSNNVWLMEMWQRNSPSVLQFSQAIYGVGTIIGPLVVRPFLTGEYDNPDESETNSTSLSKDELARSISHKLKTPFLIDGCIELIGPSLMLALFFIKPYKYKSVTKIAEEEAVTDEEKAKLVEAKRVIPRKTLITCISIFFAFGFMTENMYMDFAPTFFQFVPLRLPAPTAAEIASTMAVALTGGRLVGVFIAMKVRPQYMIIYHTCVIWIGVVIQYFLADNLVVLWFSADLICYGYSSVYVALFAFVNQYFEMTDAIGTIFIACYNSLYLFLPYFIGNNIETFPHILSYLMFGCVSVAIIDFTVILIRIRNIPKHMLRS